MHKGKGAKNPTTLPVTPFKGARSLKERGCCREVAQNDYKCPTELQAKWPRTGKKGVIE